MAYLNIGAALAACSVCLLLQWTLTATDNLFFNPLEKFPGPKILAVSRIPVTCATLFGYRAQFRFDLHHKSGEIVRVAPDELSFAHSQGWRDIYGIQAKVNPTRAMRGVEEEAGAPSVITAHGDNHTRQKRMITSMFSERTLREKEPLFVKYVDMLVERLHEAKGRPLALAD